MHIALIIEHFRASVGGAEGYAVLVMRCLRDRGHRISVFAVSGEGDDGLPVRICSLEDGVIFARDLGVDLVIDWGLNVSADVHRLGGGVHREFLRIGLVAYGSGIFAWFKRLGYLFMGKHRRIMGLEDRLFAEDGSYFVAVSDFVARQVCVVAPWLSESRVCVLLNGVDGERFNIGVREVGRVAKRAELGFGAGEFVCLFVAHNLRLKNIVLLERVFDILHGRDSRVRLLLLGKRDAGIDRDWYVYGGCSGRMEEFYGACDLLVHPTFFDACANVVLEGMACGLPVISSDCNGSAELIVNGDNGFVLPVVGERGVIVERWVDCIAGLLGDRELLERVGRRAGEMMLEHSIERYVDGFERFLLEIAGK